MSLISAADEDFPLAENAVPGIQEEAAEGFLYGVAVTPPSVVARRSRGCAPVRTTWSTSAAFMLWQP
jgi:hypothetical protein